MALPAGQLPALPATVPAMIGGNAAVGEYFPWIRLPQELRHKILSRALAKPDGYIGESDGDGVECHLGLRRSHVNTLAGAATGPAALAFHYPNCCLSAEHMKQQIHQDFLKYRGLDIAMTCQEMASDVTQVFFRDNGFEFRDPTTMFEILQVLGPDRARLIRKLRIGYDVDLRFDDFAHLFDHSELDYKGFYQLLEQDYLVDSASSDIVAAMMYAKTVANLTDFEFLYRLNVPGDFYRIGTTSDIMVYLISYIGYRLGDLRLMEFRTGNVHKKLDQDRGERLHTTYKVFAEKLSTRIMIEEIAVAMGRSPRDFAKFMDTWVSACLNHTENAIENSGVGGNRLMPPP